MLVNPSNTATIPSPVSLQWGSVSEATGYTVQLSTTPCFWSMMVNKAVTATAYIVTTSLTKGKVYYWRVQARGTYPSDWSETRSFTVQ